MGFIILELTNGKFAYVNTNNISTFFSSDNGNTRVYLTGDLVPLEVKDSPTSIDRLIKNYH